MYNISFMGKDEADKLKEQGLADFVNMAIKHSGNRWSELDAVTYYNKVMVEAGLETETLPTPEIETDGNSEGNADATGGGTQSGNGGSKGRNTRKQG